MTFGRDVGVQTWPDIPYENNNRSAQGIVADLDSLNAVMKKESQEGLGNATK